MKMTKKLLRLTIFCSLILLLSAAAWADRKEITGTTNIEDAMIELAHADYNYGDMGNGGHILSTEHCFLIRVKNVASELGENATISSCSLYIYCYQELLGAKNVYAARVFKPWVEGDENGVDDDDGDVTWNDWASDEYEWTGTGCACALNDGVDNSADDGDCIAANADRKSSWESGQSINSTGWFVWGISADLAQDWYDGSANENGVILLTTDNGFAYFYGSEHSTTALYWVFIYTSGEAPEWRNPRRKRIIGERNEETFRADIFACPSILY
jgi:hypothetical protein